MLYFSRWKTAAILAVTLPLCLAAVPNVLPKRAFDNLPNWAQRKIEPGLEFAGGVRAVLAVDSVALRRERLEYLREDVRRALREVRARMVSAPIVREGGIEVRLHEDADFDQALSKLRQLSWPPDDVAIKLAQQQPTKVAGAADGAASLTAVRYVQLPPSDIVVTTEGRTIRLAVTDAAMREHIQMARNRAIDFVARRMAALGVPRVSVQPEGTDRVLLEAPGVEPDTFDRLKHLRY
jgi:preprotein translocase subunit SecD